MPLQISEAVEGVLLGETLREVAARYRNMLLIEMGFDLEDAPNDLFAKETVRFMNELCRHFGDRYAGDRRVATALASWVRLVSEYDAYDTLLSHYEFPERSAVLSRGLQLFPGPLTAHWQEQAW